jgi:hypothetical protein
MGLDELFYDDGEEPEGDQEGVEEQVTGEPFRDEQQTEVMRNPVFPVMALYSAGLVMGTLLKAGLHPDLVIEEGNYTTRIWIPIHEDEGGQLRVLIEVIGAPVATATNPTGGLDR